MLFSMCGNLPLSVRLYVWFRFLIYHGCLVLSATRVYRAFATCLYKQVILEAFLEICLALCGMVIERRLLNHDAHLRKRGLYFDRIEARGRETHVQTRGTL